MTRFAIVVALLLATYQTAPAAVMIGENLCPVESATHVTVANGSWQDTATWRDGKIPTTGARVLISCGTLVTNNGVTADCQWVHVKGQLSACDHCNSQLNLHTLYVPMEGRFRLGMPTMPIRDGTSCVLEFVPGAAVGLSGHFLPGDWQKLSLGVVCHGDFMACGAEKGAWYLVDDTAAAGATAMVSKDAPFNWKVGDDLLIAGTDSLVGENAVRYQSEFRKITAVSSRTLTLDSALQYKHWKWRSDTPYHVANLTRNVIIRSRDPSQIENRGHLMFMTSMNDIRYTKLLNLGRTRKDIPVTDPRVDPITNMLVDGSDANPRARYSDHNHRAGPLNPASRRMWNVVDNSPGWGMVNHTSNCEWDNCIVIRTFGSGFATEEGQERGAMRRCLAALNKGQGDTINSSDGDHGKDNIGDWGTDGSGFWLQGGMVAVSDCVSFDNSGRGFALFNQPLNSYPRYSGAPVVPWIQFPLVVDPSLLTSPPYDLTKPIPSSSVLQQVFARNTAYGNKIGVQAWNAQFSVEDGLPASVRGKITDLLLWGRGNQLNLEYTPQFDIDGLVVLGDSVFRDRYFPSTNGSSPVHFGRPTIKITRLSIDGCFNRNSWPNKKPMTFVGNVGNIPTLKIEGTYPIINADTGAVIR